MDAFNNGSNEQLEQLLGSVEDLESVLSNAGPEAWALFIELTGHSEYKGMAARLLQSQGAEILPALEEAAKQNPLARDIIESIQTGEWPQYSMAIDTQINQVIQTNNADSFKQLIKNNADSDRLLDQVVSQGHRLTPLLIKMLGDVDPRTRVFAMQSLHQMGADAIDELRIAKAGSDPNISKYADSLLRYHFTGELTSKTENLRPANPFEISMGDHSGSAPKNPAFAEAKPFTPDINYLKKQLSNPGTAMETLGALQQIGRPAVPVLIELLAGSHRR